MTTNRSLMALSLALLGVTSLSAAVSAADQTAAERTKGEIAQTLHKIEQAFASGADGTTLAGMLYADDVLMVGEGENGSSHGIKKAASDITEWLKSLGPNGEKTCKYTIEEPFVATSTTFTSFLSLKCKANPPGLPEDQLLRLMCAWTKSDKGWRVVLEMWAPGHF
jgi:hypothetical protein